MILTEDWEATAILENLVGKRFDNMLELKNCINNIFNKQTKVLSLFETEDDYNDNVVIENGEFYMDDSFDLVLDYDEDEFHKVYYLLDNNKDIYVTEVM